MKRVAGYMGKELSLDDLTRLWDALLAWRDSRSAIGDDRIRGRVLRHSLQRLFEYAVIVIEDQSCGVCDIRRFASAVRLYYRAMDKHAPAETVIYKLWLDINASIPELKPAQAASILAAIKKWEKRPLKLASIRACIEREHRAGVGCRQHRLNRKHDRSWILDRRG